LLKNAHLKHLVCNVNGALENCQMCRWQTNHS
jgi:hypothetical protein